ncbi:unnamed protein product [Withania somnifera]
MNKLVSFVLLLLFPCLVHNVVHGEDPYLSFEWNVTYGTLSLLGAPQQIILINAISNNRKNSWQDGVAGTNCLIPPGKNFTYHFQVKDQIGTYFYHPSTALHRSVGGYGPITIHSRLLIPVPFDSPAEFIVFVSDWYSTSSHKTLRYGKGEDTMFTMVAGKMHRFRIQKHTMKLVEMEGSHTVQNMYGLLDLHLGQCLSVLVTADQDPKDYFIVASSSFTNEPHVPTATIRYANDNLGQAPKGWEWSLNQFNSFRWDLTASAARPNPQCSYHYGQIKYHTYRKLRYAINGISHTDPQTPFNLAQYYGIEDKVFKYNLIKDDYIPPSGNEKITIAPNVVNATFRNFVEIIFENHENSVQSWQLDRYNFLAVARSTIQVYPNSWAAVMLTLDNAGLWNLRSNSLERQYLGHQLYICKTLEIQFPCLFTAI